MIPVSDQFDLGKDRTRIKDPADGKRQQATVAALLDRFFHSVPNCRFEVQILADEVGMGKTFVALGMAYSVLAAMKEGRVEPDLRGCYNKILVLTPQNHALWQKWGREVGEFAKRCVRDGLQEKAGRWFAPVMVDRLDDLAVEFRRTGGPQVVVAHLGLFSGGKLKHYGLKRRFLLGTIFRFWGNGFRIEDRQRLLRGAPQEWGRDPYQLTVLDENEQDRMPFSADELLMALNRLAAADDGSLLEKLRQLCLGIAAPFARGREDRFAEVDRLLINIYRALIPETIRQSLPLVVVDEGHNWKNHHNGYEEFCRTVAPRTRRLLLLTATPFQLRPAEVLSILEVSDSLGICPTIKESEARREHLRDQRDSVVRRTLERSEGVSRSFAQAWSRLHPKTSKSELDAIWVSSRMETTQKVLLDLATAQGIVGEKETQCVVDEAVNGFDPGVREFFREALLLYTYNADLSQELGEVLIRHRRQTQHRAFLVGDEYTKGATEVARRPDRHVVHAADGIDVHGDGELPHYILMRCVSEMKGGKGRSSLGSALTGCYSTLLHSAEGRSVEKLVSKSELGAAYYGLLRTMVKPEADKNHPKIREVVDSVVEHWKAGEKSLVFCFRINTAERLRDIVDRRIRSEMERRRSRCLGGAEALKMLRSRLTGRDRDLIVLGLDRVLWSFLWAFPAEAPYTADDLDLTADDLARIAELSLRLGVDLEGDRIDRVFLNRVVEHVVAKRLLKRRLAKSLGRLLLEEIASLGWVTHPYGLESDDDAADDGEEQTQSNERGVHAVYHDSEVEPSGDDSRRITGSLLSRRQGAQTRESGGILDAYSRAPSLWFGSSPIPNAADPMVSCAASAIHSHLWGLSRDGKGFDWEARRRVFQALRRAVLRESVLLRLLPDRSDRDESGWGEMLVERFFSPLKNQQESMADRITVFLEDLKASSGSIVAEVGESSARQAILNATRLRDQQFVALVAGGKKNEMRERIFAGFNSPLLPEVLICTSVGQEGIDLHRQCRHVVHYDIPWNPAVLEQRTGRADRIGSKTFRERAIPGGDATSLEIGVPFLAGTYDERMFEELRLRAQTFEVLTGGDLAAENPEGADDVDPDAGMKRFATLIGLPDRMIKDLRVKLAVWEAQ